MTEDFYKYSISLKFHYFLFCLLVFKCCTLFRYFCCIFFFFFTETDNLPSFWWWCFDKFGGGRLYCCSRSKEWIKSNSDLMSRFVYNMFYQSLCLMYHQEHRAQVTWSWMTALGNAYFHGPPKIQKQQWTYVHIFIYYI